MWLTDVSRCLAIMKEKMCDFNFVCAKSILPAQNGIVVFTTYHTAIWVQTDGTIDEREVAD
jgi:hypothetical protein